MKYSDRTKSWVLLLEESNFYFWDFSFGTVLYVSNHKCVIVSVANGRFVTERTIVLHSTTPLKYWVTLLYIDRNERFKYGRTEVPRLPRDRKHKKLGKMEQTLDDYLVLISFLWMRCCVFLFILLLSIVNYVHFHTIRHTWVSKGRKIWIGKDLVIRDWDIILRW